MNDLSKSLEETLLYEDISKIEDTANPLSADYADITMSAILDDSIFGQLPVIKTLYTVGKVWGGITNYLLVEKILTFLFQLKDVEVEARKRFLNRLESTERREIINQLIIVLNNHDRFLKSAIQGRLFRAMVEGYLSRKNYFSLTHSVNLIDAELLTDLVSFYSADRGMSRVATEDIYSLASLRLIAIDNSEIGLLGGGGPQYKKNRLGVMLVTVGLKQKIPLDFVESILGVEEAIGLYKKLKL